MTKDFLGGLMAEWPPFVLELSLINRLLLNNRTSGSLLQAVKNLGLGPDISQGPVVVIAIISFALVNHNLYKPVPLPLVAIGNLQCNKTLRSVTCINSNYILNSSISLRNDSLLILRS